MNRTILPYRLEYALIDGQPDIEVLSRPNCQPCNATYRHLNRLRLAYTHRDTAEDRDALEYALALGHQQSPVVVVTYDDGRVEHWSGYRPDDLNALVP